MNNVDDSTAKAKLDESLRAQREEYFKACVDGDPEAVARLVRPISDGLAFIGIDDLRAALAAVERAAAAGFDTSRAVLQLERIGMGDYLSPTGFYRCWFEPFMGVSESAGKDPRHSWGRDNFLFLTERGLVFRDGKLMTPEEAAQVQHHHGPPCFKDGRLVCGVKHDACPICSAQQFRSAQDGPIG